jgi:hypothetical protein
VLAQRSFADNQETNTSVPNRGPGSEGNGAPSKTAIFSVAARGLESKQSSMTQSSMTQFWTGSGNWLLRRIFARRKEVGLQ